MIFVLPGSTKSGRGGGSDTPGSGKSRGGSWLELPPVSQLKKPPEDLWAILVLAYLAAIPKILASSDRRCDKRITKFIH